MVRCPGIVTVRSLATPKTKGLRKETFSYRGATRQELCPITEGQSHCQTHVQQGGSQENKHSNFSVLPSSYLSCFLLTKSNQMPKGRSMETPGSTGKFGGTAQDREGEEGDLNGHCRTSRTIGNGQHLSTGYCNKV